MYDNECIFCRIARKRSPGSIVFEDERAIAFLDTNPLNEGHTLVIPKEHHEDIFEIPAELLAYVHKVSKGVAIAVKKATKAEGISIFQQNGKAADQVVPHLHVHVVPRYEGQNMERFFEGCKADRERLEQMAINIKSQM